MLGILGNIKEYFWGSREHAVEFPGTGELNKSEFKGTYILTYFWGTREKLQFFLGNKGTCTPPWETFVRVRVAKLSRGNTIKARWE